MPCPGSHSWCGWSWGAGPRPDPQHVLDRVSCWRGVMAPPAPSGMLSLRSEGGEGTRPVGSGQAPPRLWKRIQVLFWLLGSVL